MQETFLFARTIYDNIAYAKPDVTRDEIITAAKIARAHEFIMKLPDAHNTKVGEKGYTLSGGERQRVSIVRALLHNLKILILNEATAHWIRKQNAKFRILCKNGLKTVQLWPLLIGSPPCVMPPDSLFWIKEK